MGKMIKLQFKPAKSHKNHLDSHNHFTEEGQVGEYPEDIAKEKLADFPNNFSVYKQDVPPKKKASKPAVVHVPKKQETDGETKELKNEGTKDKG